MEMGFSPQHCFEQCLVRLLLGTVFCLEAPCSDEWDPSAVFLRITPALYRAGGHWARGTLST